MIRYDLIVVGGGPSGLSAAIEASRHGLTVIVFDENHKPGGQLFKQIHKFFGSNEHKAKIRGFKIGEDLLREAADLGVTVRLNATVTGLYNNKEVTVQVGSHMEHYKGDAVIIATGAAENMVPFTGWTLPGVMGAGAAQTMMNLHGVKPGQKVLMLGSGNVGLVVSYQLLQAGCDVVAVADAAPQIGGYGVHAAKVARCGVPFYVSHTVKEVEGKETGKVTGVTITMVDKRLQPIPGTEKHFDVDTVCIAVGLSPMSQLLKMAGCKMEDNPKRGGQVPIIDENGETSLPGVFAVGDVSGIEEASSAMIEGRTAGICAAEYLGFCGKARKDTVLAKNRRDLCALREGMFGPQNKGKFLPETDEGIPISQNLLEKGFVAENEIGRFPGVTRQAGIHPVIECTQNIPCNPCQDACKFGCITVGEKITALPAVDAAAACTGCGMCVASCSGQAIFLVDETAGEDFATVTLPYEFLPLPKKGEKGTALGRDGKPVCEAKVVSVKTAPAFDKTNLLTIKIPKDKAMTARFYVSGEKGVSVCTA